MIAARLQAYTPNGATLGEMPYPLTIDPMVAHNDVGSLSFSYSNLAAGGQHLAIALQSGLEVALELSKGEKDALGRDLWVEPKGCRFVRLEDDSDPSDPTKSVTLTLPSFGWLLGKCVVGAVGAVEQRRVFTAPTVGEILLDLLDENVDRGGYATSIVPTFTATTDSSGVSWPVLPDMTFNVGDDYLTVLDGLTAAGACDWTTQARGLYLYVPDSATLSPDLSGDDGVVLSLGTDVGGAPTKRSIASMSGRVLVMASAGGVTMAEEPTATTGWGIPESTLHVGLVAGEPAAVSAGEAELERVGRPQGQFTRELILAAGSHVPLLDYWPGCWIKAPGAAGAGEKLRVQQATLSVKGLNSTGSLTLNDLMLESDERRARTLASLAGGTVSPGGPAAPIAYDPEASRIPSTPTGLDIVAALTFTGPTPRGQVTATWNAVTTATDTGTLTISGYELQWRIGAGAWQTIPTPELSAIIADLTPGDAITARVRTIAPRTTLPSAWSATDSVTVPGDVTAPSVPTGLSITSALRIASLTWAGTLTAAIPADFARIEIAMGTTSTPTTVYGVLTRAGTLQITGSSLGIAIGTTVFARARSVDSTGNASAYSTAVSVVMAGVAGPDLAANSVTANTIAVGALDGKLITGATIRTDPGTTRLEMTTSGLIAWSSGVAVAEFLPAGLYLRQGGELVVEYPAGGDALRVGFLDTAPDIRGLEVRDLAGNVAFKVATRDASAYTTITMANLDSLSITNTVNVSVHADGVSLTGGVAATSVLSLTTDAALRSEGGVGVFSIPGSTFPAVAAGEITNAYNSSWRVQPHGTPTWAGGPSSGTVAILASTNSVSVAYQSTSSSANTVLTSGGQIQRNSSSLRYKQDIEDLEVDVAAVLALRPRTWRDKGMVSADPDTTLRIPGFIAEELDALGLTQFVVYEDDVPQSIQYDRISAAQQVVLIDHETRLNDALARIASLEAA